MLMLAGEMILIFGGLAEESLYNDNTDLTLLNDLHILNLKEMQWI